MVKYLAYKEEITDKILWAVSFDDGEDGDLRAGEYLETTGLFEWLADHMKPGDSFLWEKDCDPEKNCECYEGSLLGPGWPKCPYCGGGLYTKDPQTITEEQVAAGLEKVKAGEEALKKVRDIPCRPPNWKTTEEFEKEGWRCNHCHRARLDMETACRFCGETSWYKNPPVEPEKKVDLSDD